MSVFKDDQTTYTGNVTILGSLTTNGALTIGGALAVTGNLAVTGTLTVGGNPIVAATPITNSLSGDVALSNVANYFAGPTVAQGTSGTWFASGAVTVQDTAGGAQIRAKLWDGTTVICSGTTTTSAANAVAVIALSGFIASPASNIRIDVKDVTATTGKILFNQSGESKDATVSAIRVA